MDREESLVLLVEQLASILHVSPMLILVDGCLGYLGGPSNRKVILPGQLFDIDVDLGLFEIIDFVAGFMFSLVESIVGAADDNTAFFVDCVTIVDWVFGRIETELLEMYLLLN